MHWQRGSDDKASRATGHFGFLQVTTTIRTLLDVQNPKWLEKTEINPFNVQERAMWITLSSLFLKLARMKRPESFKKKKHLLGLIKEHILRADSKKKVSQLLCICGVCSCPLPLPYWSDQGFTAATAVTGTSCQSPHSNEGVGGLATFSFYSATGALTTSVHTSYKALDRAVWMDK